MFKNNVQKQLLPLTLIMLMLATLLLTSPVMAHGLSMTTAEIALRQNRHISVTVRTSLSDLFASMQWSDKPASLLHLAGADQQSLSLFRKQIHTLFTTDMPVFLGEYPLESQQARVPGLKKIRQLLQTEIATKVLKGENGHSHDEGEQDRQNYLVIYVDGFIPKQDNKTALPELQVQFPSQLGDIMVSYVQPKVQTLIKGKKHTFYRQQLN